MPDSSLKPGKDDSDDTPAPAPRRRRLEGNPPSGNGISSENEEAKRMDVVTSSDVVRLASGVSSSLHVPQPPRQQEAAAGGGVITPSTLALYNLLRSGGQGVSAPQAFPFGLGQDATRLALAASQFPTSATTGARRRGPPHLRDVNDSQSAASLSSLLLLQGSSPGNVRLPSNHMAPANARLPFAPSNALSFLPGTSSQSAELASLLSTTGTTAAGRIMSGFQRQVWLGGAARRGEPTPGTITVPGLRQSGSPNPASQGGAAAGGGASIMPPRATPEGASTTSRTSTTSSHQKGRSVVLYMKQDDDLLSPYQSLVRKQIELFEATEDDIGSSAQGRNRPIILKQVGIRCRHCGRLPMERRARGAVYFPSTLAGLYQTAQNMANGHLLKDCLDIPADVREDLRRIRRREKSASQNTRKSAFGGGRSYWASGLESCGVVETPDRRLRFHDRPSSSRMTSPQNPPTTSSPAATVATTTPPSSSAGGIPPAAAGGNRKKES